MTQKRVVGRLGWGSLEPKVCVFAVVVGGERGEQRDREIDDRVRQKRAKMRDTREPEKEGERDSHPNGDAEKGR